MSYTTLTDSELITLLNTRDRLAFSEIFNRYWGHLYVHALKMLKDEDDAKDVVQEVFTLLWDKSGNCTILSSLQAYLFTSVRHKVLNFIRDEGTRGNYIDRFSQFVKQHHNSVLDKIEEKELKESINAVIKRMPAKMKNIFELSRNEHYSHKEIADQLNISEKTVKRQISNALYLLKSNIKKPGNMIIFMFLSSLK